MCKTLSWITITNGLYPSIFTYKPVKKEDKDAYAKRMDKICNDKAHNFATLVCVAPGE